MPVSSEWKRARDEAREHAMELLESEGIQSLPVDPFGIAKSQQLTIQRIEFDSGNIAGSTDYTESGDFIISLSKAITYEGFLHFTLAHELGHCAIPNHLKYLFSDGMPHVSEMGDSSSSIYEYQANSFAGALLMPTDLCKEYLGRVHDQRGIGLRSIRMLSRKCKVSYTAAAIRYVDLIDEAAAIFVSKNGVVEYCYTSPLCSSWFGTGVNDLRRGNALPEGMLTHQIGKDQSAILQAKQPRGQNVSLPEWFGGTETEIYEECIGLGRYGKVLTILLPEKKAVRKSGWKTNSERNLLPLSESTVFVEALKEWSYTGDMEDYDEPVECCELCEKEELRYHFNIENTLNGNRLWVGSQCIDRFKISALDEYGCELDEKESKKKVSTDRSRLIREGEKRAVKKLLHDLQDLDDQFHISNFIKYYEERGAFTPKQLATIVWRVSENKLHGRGHGLKMTIRRQREKDQLLEMQGWRVDRLWPYMSSSQKKWCGENF